MSTRAYDYIIQVASGTAFKANTLVYSNVGSASGEVIAVNGNNVKVKMSNIFSEFATGKRLLSYSGNMFTMNVAIDHSSNLATGVRSYALGTTTKRPDTTSAYINNVLIDPSEYTVSTTSLVFVKNVVVTNGVTPFSSNSNTVVFEQGSSFVIRQMQGQIDAPQFVASNLVSVTTTANSVISTITGSPYTNEKNAIEQSAIVKLYNIYYPGEFYPKNANANPSGVGAGKPWPANFPLRFAEFLGETYSDMDYSVVHGSIHYKTVALNGDDITNSGSGGIDSTTLEISNFDGNIASLIENPYLVGYSSNSTSAIINGELLTNIDPRTVADNIHYNLAVVANLGTNAVCTYESSMERGVDWISLKPDSRDLLGAVVEIKLTYANLLDYWPEYSIVTGISDTTLEVASSTPYRVGDTIVVDTPPKYSVYKVAPGAAKVPAVIESISGNILTIPLNPLFTASLGDRVYIVNTNADPQACVDYVFTINRMDELNEFIAKFSLTNWLQYFKMNVPKRKYFNETCPWKYKGVECKYPSSGSGTIVGSNPTIAANGLFTSTNVSTVDLLQDKCGKTRLACSLRNNLTNFGGFIDDKSY